MNNDPRYCTRLELDMLLGTAHTSTAQKILSRIEILNSTTHASDPIQSVPIRTGPHQQLIGVEVYFESSQHVINTMPGHNVDQSRSADLHALLESLKKSDNTDYI